MKLIMENWNRFLNEQEAPVVHFMPWLIKKTQEVHGKPGQGSVFAISAEKVAEMVKDLVSKADPAEIENAANGTGVLEREVPGIGYDLVAKVIEGRPVDPSGKEIPGEGRPVDPSGKEIPLTTQKSERGASVEVDAIKTSLPARHFSTSKLTIIIRPFSVAKKNEEGEEIIDPETSRPVMEKVPGEYIILSAFPGDTGAELPASEWKGKYVVVIPDQKPKQEPEQGDR